ncbi:hypothetical protein RN001_001045 [Aquatica leii]|uniref:Uncharacterized protein n=1 Tax=Aquatica leii TaxID=1421715 RepID=A0AAN7SKZ3_9COLE|nr:hypothetical protein RN001_001045 [Aquatica leii]
MVHVKRVDKLELVLHVPMLQYNTKTSSKIVPSAECAARLLHTKIATNKVAGTSQQSKIDINIRKVSEKQENYKISLGNRKG